MGGGVVRYFSKRKYSDALRASHFYLRIQNEISIGAAASGEVRPARFIKFRRPP
jgi:hypothetical protein